MGREGEVMEKEGLGKVKGVKVRKVTGGWKGEESKGERGVM